MAYGRWIRIKNTNFFQCSKCAHTIKDNRIYNWELYLPENYCSNCGIKMKKERVK